MANRRVPGFYPDWFFPCPVCKKINKPTGVRLDKIGATLVGETLKNFFIDLWRYQSRMIMNPMIYFALEKEHVSRINTGRIYSPLDFSTDICIVCHQTCDEICEAETADARAICLLTCGHWTCWTCLRILTSQPCPCHGTAPPIYRYMGMTEDAVRDLLRTKAQNRFLLHADKFLENTAVINLIKGPDDAEPWDDVWIIPRRILACKMLEARVASLQDRIFGTGFSRCTVRLKFDYVRLKVVFVESDNTTLKIYVYKKYF